MRTIKEVLKLKTRFILITAVVLIFAFNVSALFAAQEAEYYVYNGFDAVLGAFQKIALIFGDNGYKTLFFAIIVMGIIFGSFAALAKIAMGARSSPLSWAIPAGLGIALYLALFIPKGTIHLYDPVKNKYQAIGNIPDGIVALVGTLNKIERGLVDIISTAGTPMSYQEQAGGVGFDMFNIIGSKGVLLTDKNIHNNLREYVDKCLFFELLRPGTTISINGLANNTDFIPIFEQAMNPAIYTVYYSDTHPEGETLQCSVAWPLIAADITNVGNYTIPLREMCANAGFDPTNAEEFNRCQETLSDTTNYLWGAAYENVQVLRQTLMSETINDVVMSASPDTAVAILASRNTGTQWLSSGMVANDFIPVLKAALTAIAIAMIPFFVMFIPTPIVGRALTLISGLFIWLTAWGITDAVMHQFAVEYGKKAFYEVVNYGLGMTAISNFSTVSMKTMAAFAGMRWSGLMLATVMTGILVKFGGQALAMLSGGLTGSVSSTASSAGHGVVTPEGAAQTVHGMENAPATFANAYKFSHLERARIQTALAQGRTGGYNEVANDFGASGLEDMTKDATASQAVSSGAKGKAIENRGLRETSQDLTSASGVALSKQISHAEAEKDKYDYLKQNGILPGNTTFEEYQRTTQLSTEVNTPDGKLRTHFSPNGEKLFSTLQGTSEGGEYNITTDAQGNVVAGERKGIFTFTDRSGAERQINGALAMRGQEFSVQGIDAVSGRKVSMTGAANDVDLKHGSISGYNTFSEQDASGISERVNVSKAEALKILSPLKGTNLYKGVESMNSGSVALGVERNTATGEIASVTATQGGRSSNFDHSTKLTGNRDTTEALREVNKGYREWTGLQVINENTYDKVGIIKGKDPETGKEGSFYGKQHYVSATKKLVAAEYTNLTTGKVFTVKTEKNPDGTETKHYGVGTYESGPNGSSKISNFRELSHKEIQKGMYAANITSGPGGTVLNEKDVAGQNTIYSHKFVMDLEKKMDATYASGVGRKDDLTKLKDWQVGVIMGTSVADKAVSDIARVGRTIGMLHDGVWKKSGNLPRAGRAGKDYLNKNIPVKPGSNVGEIVNKK